MFAVYGLRFVFRLSLVATVVGWIGNWATTDIYMSPQRRTVATAFRRLTSYSSPSAHGTELNEHVYHSSFITREEWWQRRVLVALSTSLLVARCMSVLHASQLFGLRSTRHRCCERTISCSKTQANSLCGAVMWLGILSKR